MQSFIVGLRRVTAIASDPLRNVDVYGEPLEHTRDEASSAMILFHDSGGSAEARGELPGGPDFANTVPDAETE